MFLADTAIAVAVIGGAFGLLGILVTGIFGLVVARRVGKPNGLGNVTQMLESLHGLVEPIVASQYDLIERNGALTEQVGGLSERLDSHLNDHAARWQRKQLRAR